LKKIKYFYNTHTLRYEKLVTPLRVRLLRVFSFFAVAFVTAAIIVVIAYKYFPSANEKRLQQQNEDLRQGYSILNQELRSLQLEMNELERRDNDVYRSIFEAAPIPDSARVKQMARRKEIELVTKMSESDLVENMTDQLNNLKLRVAFQERSFGDIRNMVKNKEKLLAAIPAIQPVSNKNLTRMASGYGVRIDPVYKVRKMHAGLDFTAPQGTPIYATADGRIKEASFNAGGYGNNVVINHGYGYETLYGHMYRVKVRAGQIIKRGEVIGWVGNTGKSTGPHCHYEVHKNGKPINPVYYFYNDLTPEQFDRMLKLAATGNQSLD
jgi:murein DD-endopeptidase MepM/ murein hydrolase activator NlpD